MHGRLAGGFGVGIKLFESGLAFIEFLAETAVKARITLFYHCGDGALLENCSRIEKGVGHGIHGADVRDEDVLWIGRP